MNINMNRPAKNCAIINIRRTNIAMKEGADLSSPFQKVPESIPFPEICDNDRHGEKREDQQGNPCRILLNYNHHNDSHRYLSPKLDKEEMHTVKRHVRIKITNGWTRQ